MYVHAPEGPLLLFERQLWHSQFQLEQKPFLHQQVFWHPPKPNMEASSQYQEEICTE